MKIKVQLTLLLLIGTTITTVSAQQVAVKTNLLYDVMTNINLGVEIGLGRKTSLDVSGQINPWTYDGKTNSKFKHIMVQPELRYWLCERFAGHFFGIHPTWARYNVGAMDLPLGLTKNTLANYRYNGNLYGAGLGYGYQWVFRKRWALEAEVGAGYLYLNHKKYGCESCGEFLGNHKVHYFGPTKAAVSLLFFIK